MKYIFKNKVFGIREYQKCDEESIAKYANDKSVYRGTLVMPYPYTLKDAKKWVSHNVRNYKKKNVEGMSFVIEVGGQAVGSIGVHKIIANHKGEMGYWLGKEFRGNGIMSRAVKEVSNYAFREFKLKRVYAGVFSFNKISMRVLEKAGFKREGFLRKNILKDDKYIDEYVYARVK